MPRTGLTAGQLRAKAVESTIHQIRRHGFEKVRLVDVAKEVGVTHAALYGHFKDKSALLDAVSEKWLNSLEEKLLQVCQKEKDPIARIQEWFFRLHELKCQKVTNEPELYKAFDFAAKMKKSFYKEHLTRMTLQLTGMIKEAVAQKKLTRYSPEKTTSLLLEATTGFHNPRLIAEHAHEKRDNLLKQLLDAVMKGLN